ncbi:DUF1189 family protein [Acholeplasma hippikon]|uniref:DUF1189 domain-containing protein n=1 Tax=Acholeplasma hippikon TaxID=264636 RepID=A0A449BK72_9MOLU|nr:DUF1189 family protein [Acholeplasma hippikon]VEU82842.1 Uncharacterised protein [Acholeplasma hippikon]
MYQKFKRGLLKPRELGLYLADSWGKTWSYFFLLAAILFLPLIAIESTYSGLSTGELNTIEENYRTYFVSDSKVIDGKLVYDVNLKDSKQLVIGFYDVDFYQGETLYQSMVTLKFKETGIELKTLGFQIAFKSYEELGLNNFDFNDYSITNRQKLSNALNKMVIDNNIPVKIIYLVFALISTLFDLLVMVAIAAYFGPLRFPFKVKFKISVYCATIYAVFVLFANLFNLEILVFIGMIALVAYIRRAFSTIIMR